MITGKSWTPIDLLVEMVAGNRSKKKQQNQLILISAYLRNKAGVEQSGLW